MFSLIQLIFMVGLFFSVPPRETTKEIPPVIKAEVREALKYFPELKDVPIKFVFKKKIRHSTMQAQPIFSSLLKSRKKREYVIKISEKIKIEGETFYTRDIPEEVMIGWIGHELGHLMDYQNHSNLGMLWFGVQYLLSDNYIVEAERAADMYAVRQGMSDFIIKTKNFILNHSKIANSYKDRIKKYYLSPKEIIMLAEGENLEKMRENSIREIDFIH